MKRVAGGILGLVAFVYLRFCYLTSRFLFTPSADESMRSSWERGVSTVFVCWHDEFLLSLLSMQTARFRGILFITNDSFGGVFLETFCRCLGIRSHVIRREVPRHERLRSMADGLAVHRAMAIAADYGRPWFRARPTAWQLARLTEGVVVACRIEPSRKLRIKIGDRYAYVPVPFARYALTTSAPLTPSYAPAAPLHAEENAAAAAALLELPRERDVLDRELNELRTRTSFAIGGSEAAPATPVVLSGLGDLPIELARSAPEPQVNHLDQG
jgi:lysophospholipid acyltransferase (LPLAT)-like uncharacterized protein